MNTMLAFDEIRLDRKLIISKVVSLGERLRKAMGSKELLLRNSRYAGEFRVPTFRSYAEEIQNGVWIIMDESGMQSYVSSIETKNPHESFLPYEYAYGDWLNGKHYHPYLLDGGTFGHWLELLPQPVSLCIENKKIVLKWNSIEPRIHNSEKMGRYCLPQNECFVEQVIEHHWRLTRAEVYVMAWEKMAANEPKDRYESVITETIIPILKHFGKMHKNHSLEKAYFHELKELNS